MRLVDTATGTIVTTDDSAGKQLLTSLQYRLADADKPPKDEADDKPPPRKRGRPRKAREG